MAGGRPTEYDPEYCDCVIQWGKQGKSLAWMASQMDVSKQTVRNWMEQHPEFLAAMTRAQTHSQAFWEDMGQNGIMTPGFGGSVWSRSMAARFPDDWREKSETKLTGDPNAPLQTVTRIELAPLTGGDGTD